MVFLPPSLRIEPRFGQLLFNSITLHIFLVDVFLLVDFERLALFVTFSYEFMQFHDFPYKSAEECKLKNKYLNLLDLVNLFHISVLILMDFEIFKSNLQIRDSKKRFINKEVLLIFDKEDKI